MSDNLLKENDESATYLVTELQKAKRKAGASLWHLGEDFMNVANLLDPNDSDTVQALSDTMESIGFDETASDILSFTDELEDIIETRKKRISELTAKNKSDKALYDKIRKTLLAMAIAMGRKTIGDVNRAARLQYGPDGMEILEEDDIPDQYKEEKMILTSEKKKALKQLVIGGEEIPGTKRTDGKPFFKKA
jgi:hypothetical protein